jgi:hypothetical protein
MEKTILLNDKEIPIIQYDIRSVNNLYQLTIEFKVSSGKYHEITTLLYKGEFDIKIPDTNTCFRGVIQEYSTSVTNLYESGNVGDFKLVLKEKKE